MTDHTNEPSIFLDDYEIIVQLRERIRSNCIKTKDGKARRRMTAELVILNYMLSFFKIKDEK